MLKRLRSGVAIQSIVLGAMLVAIAAPPALTFYRCHMMGRTMSSPCAGDDDVQAGGETAELQEAPCCTKVTIELERAPSESTPARGGLAAGVALARPVSVGVALPPVAQMAAVWLPAQFDPGPILQRVCSLLI